MKKILYSLAVIAAAAAAIVAVNAGNRLDKQFEANLEALAQTESGSGTNICYNRIVNVEGQWVRYCPTCQVVPGRNVYIFGEKGKC